MRSERKARISGLAGTQDARTLPDLTFPVTEWDLGTRLDDPKTPSMFNTLYGTIINTDSAITRIDLFLKKDEI